MGSPTGTLARSVVASTNCVWSGRVSSKTVIPAVNPVPVTVIGVGLTALPEVGFTLVTVTPTAVGSGVGV
jgi:hypothetical protein